MNDDADLLRQFADANNEAGFSTVVQRHIGFVYAVSLRRVRDPHLAQDATQAVFITLARKAASVARAPSVIGWLHRSACYETSNIMRAQRNRVARESEAQRLGTTTAESASPSTAIEAVLDEVLRELSDKDREAILARYFSSQSYRRIGAALSLSENAARMRVDRALLKLRDGLQTRGITSTAAALAVALPSCASAVVPAGLAAAVTKASIAGATAAGAAAAGYLVFMSTVKIVVAAAAVAAVAGFVYEYRQTSSLETSLAVERQDRTVAATQIKALEQQVNELKRQVTQTASTVRTSSASPTAAALATADASPPSPGMTPKTPPGWIKNGSNTKDFEVGTDTQQQWGGMPSAYVRSLRPGAEGFAGMMQTTSAEAYLDKRVRLTGWVKTEDANQGGGHLWLRIDGQERGQMLQFDNMDGRAPKGTTDWQEYSVVLDVPPGSSALNYGYFISGAGKMWVNGITIDQVGPEVPSTNLLKKTEPPKTPVNLGFAAPQG